MKPMDIHNHSPHYIPNMIITFFLFVFGHHLNEIELHLPQATTLHELMSLAKAFAYVGSGLVGTVTFFKWLQASAPKALKWLKHHFRKKK